jgi:excisionase family DNA binding protein
VAARCELRGQFHRLGKPPARIVSGGDVMDAAVYFLVLFLVFCLLLGVIVFAARAAEPRVAAARAKAARAEKEAQAHRNRASISGVDKVDADDDAAALFHDKVPKQFLYTKQQAATALAMSTARLNELLRARKIRAVKDGGRVKFAAADLQAYVDSLPSLGGPPAAEPERNPGEMTTRSWPYRQRNGLEGDPNPRWKRMHGS